MTVSLKRKGERWVADITLRWWDDSYYRERRSVPLQGFHEAKLWAKAREQYLLRVGPANAKIDRAKKVRTVPQDKGWVYFIRGHDKLIKIGWSRNPTKRLEALQTGAAVGLVTLRVLSAAVHTEKELHRRFAYLRVRGEWFKPGEELVEFIRHLETPPGEERHKLRKAPVELRGVMHGPALPPPPAKEVSPWLLCKPHGRQHCVACYAPKYGVAAPS